MWIVIIGSLTAGLRFVGPFDSEADALRWQAEHAAGHSYEIVWLEPPL